MHQIYAIFVPDSWISAQTENIKEDFICLLAWEVEGGPLVVRQCLLIHPVSNRLLNLLFNLLLAQNSSLHPIFNILIGLFKNKSAALFEVFDEELEDLHVAVESTLMDEGVAESVYGEDKLIHL